MVSSYNPPSGPPAAPWQLRGPAVGTLQGPTIEAAFFAAAVLLLLGARTLIAGPLFLVDPDLGWHLTYGHQILQTWSLPTNDQWSVLSNGAQYQLTQWAGEAMLAAGESLAGDVGVGAVTAICLSATLAGTYLASRLAGASSRSAMLATVICTGPLVWGLARPVVFTWAFYGIATAAIAQLRLKRSVLAVSVLVAICSAWPSFHGAFALGVPLVAIAAVFAVREETSEGWARKGALGIAIAGVCLLATLLNPYGWKVWEAVWRVGQLETTHGPMFADWQHVDPTSLVAVPLWIGSAAVVVGSAKKMWPWWVSAVATFMCALGFWAARNLPMATITVAPLTAVVLSSSLRHLQRRPQEIGASKPLRTRLTSAAAFTIAATVLVWAMAAVRDHEAYREAEAVIYPVGASTIIHDRDIQGTVLSEVEHGGWWIRRHPGLRVWIDGRADLHGDRLYRQVKQVLDAEPGWEDTLRSMNPTIVSLRSRSNLFAVDLRPTFELIHDNGLTKVWVQKQPPSNNDSVPLQQQRPH